MFEAHFSHVEDFQGLEAIAHSWTKIYYRRHAVSFQPLKIWFAKGKVNNTGGVQRKIFAYIEYQDEQGSDRYCCLALAAGLSISEALSEATRADVSSAYGGLTL